MTESDAKCDKCKSRSAFCTLCRSLLVFKSLTLPTCVLLLLRDINEFNIALGLNFSHHSNQALNNNLSFKSLSNTHSKCVIKRQSFSLASHYVLPICIYFPSDAYEHAKTYKFLALNYQVIQVHRIWFRETTVLVLL